MINPNLSVVAPGRLRPTRNPLSGVTIAPSRGFVGDLTAGAGRLQSRPLRSVTFGNPKAGPQ